MVGWAETGRARYSRRLAGEHGRESTLPALLDFDRCPIGRSARRNMGRAGPRQPPMDHPGRADEPRSRRRGHRVKDGRPIWPPIWRRGGWPCWRRPRKISRRWTRHRRAEDPRQGLSLRRSTTAPGRRGSPSPSRKVLRAAVTNNRTRLLFLQAPRDRRALPHNLDRGGMADMARAQAIPAPCPDMMRKLGAGTPRDG